MLEVLLGILEHVLHLAEYSVRIKARRSLYIVGFGMSVGFDLGSLAVLLKKRHLTASGGCLVTVEDTVDRLVQLFEQHKHLLLGNDHPVGCSFKSFAFGKHDMDLL